MRDERAAPVTTERHEVVVIGGGQAGLALGYELALRQVPFVILDQSARVGHSWRNRWDSLTLFTPHPYNDLPGLRFPGMPGRYPTKDEVADYLEQYVATFALPVRLNCRVTALRRVSSGYLVETAMTRFLANQVVIATGPFQLPVRPAWSNDLPAHVFQIHTSQYRNPEQLPPGDVLVVGAGNSGVQIAAELAPSRTLYLAVGKRLLHLPRQVIDQRLFWRLYTRAARQVTIDTRLGRWLSHQDVLFGTSLRGLSRDHGVAIVGRARGVAGDRVVVGRKRAIRVRSVVWATGYASRYRWVEVPVFNRRGAPVHRRGLTAFPGLYFLGLFWQQSARSVMLGGIGNDATFIAAQIAAQVHGDTVVRRLR